MNTAPQYRNQKQRDQKNYIIGGVLSVILTIIAFAAVAWLDLARATTLTIIAIAAVIQMVVQLRFFLHIDLKQENREDLYLILFTLLLLGLMAGGTLWIMGDLMVRMH